MLRIPLTRAAIALFLSTFLWSQVASEPQSAAKIQQRREDLRREFKNTKKLVESGRFRDVQISFAKMGEREPLQQILCELDFGAPVVQSSAFGKLQYVGGWFSIKALSKYLPDSPVNMQGKYDAFGMYVSPQIMAMKILPLVVSNPPLGVANAMRLVTFNGEREQAVKTWIEWLGKNSDSLRVLQPVGEDIVSTEKACHDILKDDPDSSAYSTVESQPRLRPPQEVVEEYTKLGNDGGLLTSGGWDRAQAFFLHHVPPPEPIYVTEKHAAQLHWMKENKAEVDQEYVPIGQIDSSLRYIPPPSTRYGKFSIAFKLTLSDKHWETGVNGKESELTSSTAWRIENPQVRWASLKAAIQYTERMSAKTKNNLIKQNAARTIARLKQYLLKKQAASPR